MVGSKFIKKNIFTIVRSTAKIRMIALLMTEIFNFLNFGKEKNEKKLNIEVSKIFNLKIVKNNNRDIHTYWRRGNGDTQFLRGASPVLKSRL